MPDMLEQIGEAVFMGHTAYRVPETFTGVMIVSAR